jgi:hypothetical protein
LNFELSGAIMWKLGSMEGSTMAANRLVNTVTRSALIALIIVLAGAAARPTGGATAFTATPARLWITDGDVHAVAATPSSVYVGGDFELIGAHTGSWVEIDPAGRLARPWPLV